MKKATIALLALAFTLAVVTPALAQDPVPAAVAAQDPKQETKTAQTERMGTAPTALRKEIVRLKYVRADQISVILRSFTSPWGHIQCQNSLPFVLSVSDASDNVEKILAVIRELDIKPADVLYTVQLVLGTAGETDQGTKPVPENDAIIRELRSLLRYKTYSLLDSTLVRTVNMDRAEVKFGPKAEFALELRPEVAGDAKMPVIKTNVRLRRVDQPGFYEGKPITNVVTLVESTLNIKSGDRTVVGVSKLDGGDKGLILIISAKIVD